MKKLQRNSRRLYQGGKPPISVQFSGCRALILIDAKPIKMEEQKKCLKLQSQIESAKLEITQHESLSVPDCRRWMNQQFAKEIAAGRELTQKVFELEDLVSMVQAQCSLSGASPAQVYAKVLDLKERERELDKMAEQLYESEKQGGFTHRDSSGFSESENYEFDPDGSHRSGGSERSDGHRGSQSDSEQTDSARAAFKRAHEQFEEGMLRNAFEALFGTEKKWRSPFQTYDEAFAEFKKEQARHQERSYRPGSHRKPTPQSAGMPATRIRDLYRSLARKFHPDANPHQDVKQRELWLKVQAAYDAQNLSALESLTTLGYLFDQDWDRIDSVSSLRNLWSDLKRTFNQLNKKIREARKEYAWKFEEIASDPAALKLLEKRIRSELKADQSELVEAKRDLERLIDSWSKRKSKKGHSVVQSSKRSNDWDDFSDFMSW